MADTAHHALPAASAKTRPPGLSPGVIVARTLLVCGIAVFAGLTLTYLVRVMLNLDAFQNPDVAYTGFPNSGALTVGIITATLLAVAVIEVLRQATPRPAAAFAIVMALGYVAFFGVTAFTSNGLTPSQIAGQLVVCLPLAFVIGLLALWATGLNPEMPS